MYPIDTSSDHDPLQDSSGMYHPPLYLELAGYLPTPSSFLALNSISTKFTPNPGEGLEPSNEGIKSIWRDIVCLAINGEIDQGVHFGALLGLWT